MTISTLLILAVRRTHVIHEPSSVPARHESFVAQWLEHPTGGRKVLSSVPIGNSVFSLSCARDMLHHYITSFLIRIYYFFSFNFQLSDQPGYSLSYSKRSL